MRRTSIYASAALVALAAMPVHAASSTSQGQISVAQVIEFIEKSSSDTAARTAVAAYLIGIGETLGLIMADDRVQQAHLLTCKSPLSLSDADALRALKAAVTDPANRQETPATPIILVDMLGRAGCE